MNNRTHDEVWESLGAEDADWAVASTPGMKHGRWSSQLQEFYDTGRARVDEALALLPELRFHRALDWGSGTGRLSFALAERFENVTCVDISTTMLTTLRERAGERGITNLEPRHLDDFKPSSDHDFALCLITLQHFPDRQSVAAALAAMVGSLRPGGVLLAEIPVRPLTLKYRVQPRLQAYRALRKLGVSPSRLHRFGLSGISMLCVPQSWTEEVVREAGAEMLRTLARRGTSHEQVYYVARRRQ